MTPEHEAMMTLDRLEAELARFREIADWYKGRDEPVPLDVQVAVKRIVARLSEMLSPSARRAG